MARKFVKRRVFSGVVLFLDSLCIRRFAIAFEVRCGIFCVRSYVLSRGANPKNRRVKVYKITKSGDLILRRAIVKQAEILSDIGALFREFARDVLNIDNATNSMPNLPSFFTPFLEDNPNSEENLKHLELERQHIHETLRSMQEKLRKIDSRIREIKKQSQTGSSPPTQK